MEAAYDEEGGGDGNRTLLAGLGRNDCMLSDTPPRSTANGLPPAFCPLCLSNSQRAARRHEWARLRNRSYQWSIEPTSLLPEGPPMVPAQCRTGHCHPRATAGKREERSRELPALSENTAKHGTPIPCLVFPSSTSPLSRYEVKLGGNHLAPEAGLASRSPGLVGSFEKRRSTLRRHARSKRAFASTRLKRRGSTLRQHRGPVFPGSLVSPPYPWAGAAPHATRFAVALVLGPIFRAG